MKLGAMTSDGIKSYALGIAAWRELCIRSGSVQPSKDDPDELRWAREGKRDIPDLDTVRAAGNPRLTSKA